MRRKVRLNTWRNHGSADECNWCGGYKRRISRRLRVIRPSNGGPWAYYCNTAECFDCAKLQDQLEGLLTEEEKKPNE